MSIYREIAPDTEKFADHNVLERECHHILNKALQQQFPQRRLVISLSRQHGLTHDEIAFKLNLSRHTVRNTIAEGLKVIWQFLEEHHYPVFITNWSFPDTIFSSRVIHLCEPGAFRSPDGK